MTYFNFTCRRCGENKLTYKRWVECNEDVIIHNDGHIEYCQYMVDTENDLEACNGYTCRNCGRILIHCGSIIAREDRLVMYLMLDQDEREEEEQIYQGMVQEQIEKEISCGFGGKLI